jgi:superfamily I DNA and/or RNA helicase
VQGKEADVVVVVLGSRPARAWAAERPNLLNVAVSQARRRLYVIGNRQNWQDHRYFDVLAAALPSR